ncbi:hypothetical protein [Klenkia brasiliensis]|uniref:Uncharacterized protein n=1 Tax=Klenkia brasiliensis TaxID=333142 RepID=A0A1G7UH11_9ACTN|nr:hypothetical protein [Klenkia brasiliensis]SDG46060.1 hypothetical protein SAMN05660324_2607 [Klenkia brasiliensis]
MRPPAPPPPRRRRALLVGAVLIGTATLSACQLPDVSMSPSAAEVAVTSAPAATSSSPADRRSGTGTTDEAVVTSPATTEAVAAPTRPAGELDTGSATHVVTAGDRQVVVDWWTTQQATAWTADVEKSVQLAAHLEGGDPDLEVLITRFSAVLDDGTTRTSLVDDRGEFAFQPPYPYGTALTVPASPAGTASVSLDVQFDLLVETEPGSQRYFRQTVLDTLVLPFAAPAGATPSQETR